MQGWNMTQNGEFLGLMQALETCAFERFDDHPSSSMNSNTQVIIIIYSIALHCIQVD
jgi:hypothetical protein